MNPELKHTPLQEIYGDYPKAKLIDFGGWELPVDYGDGIIPEHTAVRNAAGLFDVSHMGEGFVEGKDATRFLSWMTTNHIGQMADGQCMYTLMCYENGTVVDDLMIYRRDAEHYLVVFNAANIEKDVAWLGDHLKGFDCMLANRSSEYGQLALQGPKAVDVLSRLVPDCGAITHFTFREQVCVGSVVALVSRTGYTGEDGFELYCASSELVTLWKTLLDAGKDAGLVPCGLGCRDTLRLEAKLPLYGHEISDSITPLEANLGVFVDFEKGDFCGRTALCAQKDEGVPRSLRGVEMIDGGVPRAGYKVFAGETEIGYVTSGTKSPTLDAFVAYVLVKRDTGLKFGDFVFIDIHGQKRKAVLVKTPFFKRTTL